MSIFYTSEVEGCPHPSVVAVSQHPSVATGPGAVACAAASGHTVSVHSADGAPLVSGRPDPVANPGGQPCSALAWSPAAPVLAVGWRDGGVGTWSAAARRLRQDGRPIHGGRVSHLAWSPDGTRLASGAADGTVTIWGPAGPGGSGAAQTTTGRDEASAGSGPSATAAADCSDAITGAARVLASFREADAVVAAVSMAPATSADAVGLGGGGGAAGAKASPDAPRIVCLYAVTLAVAHATARPSVRRPSVGPGSRDDDDDDDGGDHRVAADGGSRTHAAGGALITRVYACDDLGRRTLLFEQPGQVVTLAWAPPEGAAAAAGASGSGRAAAPAILVVDVGGSLSVWERVGRNALAHWERQLSVRLPGLAAASSEGGGGSASSLSPPTFFVTICSGRQVAVALEDDPTVGVFCAMTQDTFRLEPPPGAGEASGGPPGRVRTAGVSALSWSVGRSELVAGFSRGALATWSWRGRGRRNDGHGEDDDPATLWSPPRGFPARGPVAGLALGRGGSGGALVAASCRPAGAGANAPADALTIVRSAPPACSVGGGLAVVQLSATRVAMDSDGGGAARSIDTGLQIVGVHHSCAAGRAVVWSGRRCQVYRLAEEGPILDAEFDSASSSLACECVSGRLGSVPRCIAPLGAHPHPPPPDPRPPTPPPQTRPSGGPASLFECHPGGVRQRDYSGALLRTLDVDPAFGAPAAIDLSGSTLAVATEGGCVELHTLDSRGVPSLLGSGPRRLQASATRDAGRAAERSEGRPDGPVASVRLSSDGRALSVLVGGRVWVHDTAVGSTALLRLPAGGVPVAHAWDAADPRLLGVETRWGDGGGGDGGGGGWLDNEDGCDEPAVAASTSASASASIAVPGSDGAGGTYGGYAWEDAVEDSPAASSGARAGAAPSEGPAAFLSVDDGGAGGGHLGGGGRASSADRSSVVLVFCSGGRCHPLDASPLGSGGMSDVSLLGLAAPDFLVFQRPDDDGRGSDDGRDPGDVRGGGAGGPDGDPRIASLRMAPFRGLADGEGDPTSFPSLLRQGGHYGGGGFGCTRPMPLPRFAHPNTDSPTLPPSNPSLPASPSTRRQETGKRPFGRHGASRTTPFGRHSRGCASEFDGGSSTLSRRPISTFLSHCLSLVSRTTRYQPVVTLPLISQA